MQTLTIPKTNLPAMIDTVAQSLRRTYPELMKPINPWAHKWFIIQLIKFQENDEELKLTYEAKTIAKETI